MKQYEYQRTYELEQSYWWFAGVRAMVEELLALGGRAGALGRVLDVGCGTGALLDQLCGRCEELVGVDISEEALSFCRQRGHANLLKADACSIDQPDHSFDVITAIGVIEHVDDDTAFLAEMARLLKPGGITVLLTSSFPWLWSMHDTANEHRRRYYLKDLRRKIERAGFDTIRFSHLNFLLFPVLAAALLGHRVLKGVQAEMPERILPRVPAPLNAALTGVLKTESRAMRWVSLPWGVSMIGVFRLRTV